MYHLWGLRAQQQKFGSVFSFNAADTANRNRAVQGAFATAG